MKRREFLPLGILGMSLPAGAGACVWDRDTALAEARLAREAKGRFDIVAAIVGIFDRNPPLYYQMRLDRVSTEVKATGSALNLYDDAGVACDRLGKADEAIRWMEKKKAEMDRHGDAVTSDDRYRYLANLGTFHAHRWMKQQDRQEQKQGLASGIQNVEAALKENPSAHFNRELFQLALLKWMNEASPKHATAEDPLAPMKLFFQVSKAVQRDLQRADSPMDVCNGLAGLIHLGAAWESVDVYVLLAEGLNRADKWSLAELAQMRVTELVSAGRRSSDPGQTYNGRVVEDRVIPPHVTPQGIAQMQSFYSEARKAVRYRETLREGYMTALLKEGRHPDTHSDFWKDWKEPAMPNYPN